MGSQTDVPGAIQKEKTPKSGQNTTLPNACC